MTDVRVPAELSAARWPIFDVIIDDFKAFGNADLAADSITAQATNGWLSVYALVKVMRDTKATEITRATVQEAFDQAKNIPVFKLRVDEPRGACARG